MLALGLNLDLSPKAPKAKPKRLTQQSLQSYTYDRWGNRTINVAQTWGTGINSKQFTVDLAGTNRLNVPAGQSGEMSYDNAGNLTTDTYSGYGVRTYDAENRMTTAADNMGQTSRYTYDADGSRTRRQVAGGEICIIAARSMNLGEDSTLTI